MRHKLLLAMVLNCILIAQAKSGGVLLVKDYAFDPSSEAKPIVYVSLQAFPTVQLIKNSAGKEERIYNQLVVKNVPFISSPEIITQSDYQTIRHRRSEVESVIKQWPASQKFLKDYLNHLKDSSDQFLAGNVYTSGEWMSGSEYTRRLQEHAERERLAALAEIKAKEAEEARLREKEKERLAQLCEKGKIMETAARYDDALELYKQLASKTDIQRVAEKMAKDFEAKKDYESSANYYETAGLFSEAGRIRTTHDLSKETVRRKLGDQEIFKCCGSACVTVVLKDAEDYQTGIGSGFFVAKGGYILTNHHVIEDASGVAIITASGKRIEAKVLESSAVPDLALLKADVEENPVLRLGSSESVQTGAYVATIGSPKGEAQSYTAGNISNTDRLFEGNKCFQISVLINHGNSGGPLLDEMGEVIGITSFGLGTLVKVNGGRSAIGTDVQGMNYAIKINEAVSLLRKHIPRRYLPNP